MFYDDARAMVDRDMQAVVARTGFGAALALVLIATGVQRHSNVFSPEYFEAPALFRSHGWAGFGWRCVELTPQQL